MFSTYSTLCKENGIYIALIYRSHSERVPNKVNRPFTEEDSLLTLKIKQLRQVFPANRIILVGDNEEWLKRHFSNEIQNLHDCVFITRDIDYMIGNDRPFSEVLAHTYDLINRSTSCGNIKHLLITYPTCPTFMAQQYKNVLVDYYTNVVKGKYDSIMSSLAKKGFFWYNGIEVNYRATAAGHQYTQDIKPVYEADNAIWGGDFEKLLESKYLINRNPYFFKNDLIHAVDVDTLEDFKRAQLIYKALLND